MPPQAPTPQPHMQSMVHYMGTTVFTGGYGLLQWDQDGHIRLYSVDPATKQVKDLLFDCLPNQIEKIRITMSTFSLKLAGKTYNLDFSSSAVPWLAAGGLLGLFMSSKKTKESGVQWWADNLKAQGVVVKQFNMRKTTIVTFAVVFGLIFFVFILAIVAAVLSSGA